MGLAGKIPGAGTVPTSAFTKCSKDLPAECIYYEYMLINR